MQTTAIRSALAGAALALCVPGLAIAQQSGLQQNGQQIGQQQFGQQQQLGQRQQLEGEGVQLYASPNEVTQVKRHLAQLGLNPGTLDGNWNDQVEDALESFQQQRGLSPTGNLNLSTLSALGVQIGQDGLMLGIGEPGMQRGRLGQRQMQPGQQFGQMQPGQQLGQTQTWPQQQYGQMQPGTRQQHGQRAQQRMQQRLGQRQQLEGEGAPLFVSPIEVRQVEQRLSQLGLDPGSIDGRWSEETQNAIERFQQQRGLSTSGNLNLSTLTALGVQIGREGRFLGIGEQQGQGMQQPGMQHQGMGMQQRGLGQTGQQNGMGQGMQSQQQGQDGN
ncbi:MAG: peptidoglycan-binding protein [Hyphomicrobiaceae bacterium]|nr:peptidoglycan-binding protein [Hyphomicrobiaceae bacterium]